MTPRIRVHHILFFEWVGGATVADLAEEYAYDVAEIEAMLRRYGWVLRQPVPEFALARILNDGQLSGEPEAMLRAAVYCYEHEVDWPLWLREAMKKPLP